MGNACAALNDQPRPNPKDPTINLCSSDTVSKDDTSSEDKIPAGGSVGAQYYCNLRGSNPKLRYGFSDFSNLAQTDPDKYGKILFDSINSKLYGGKSDVPDPNSILASGNINLTSEQLASIFGNKNLDNTGKIKALATAAGMTLEENTALQLAGGSLAAILSLGVETGALDLLAIAAVFLAGGISSAITEGNASYEKDYCNKIGDTFEGDSLLDTEWAVYNNPSGHCYYNDGDRGYATEKDKCCNGSCSIIGARLTCVRQNFRADPFVCCFNDFNCNKTNGDSCFQTPARQRTCHPNYRDLSSETCRDIIYDYCVGNKTLPTQNDWLEMWLEDSFVELNSKMMIEKNQFTTTGHYNTTPDDIHARGRRYPNKQKQPCLRAIARAVSNSQICTFEDLQNIDVVDAIVNSEGFEWAKGVIKKVFDKYNDEGGSFLGGINTDGLNRSAGFQNTFWKICNKIPGLCTEILNEACKSYTTDDIVSNPNLSQWCSCYMDKSEYEKYEKFDIQKECTPICNRDGVIPSITTEGQVQFCLSTVCMIDEVTVKLVNVENTGSINFNQICPSCGSSTVKSRYEEKENKTSSTNDNTYALFGIVPPERDKNGDYSSVYGDGYDDKDPNLPPCYIIPSGDYDNFKNNSNLSKTDLDPYPQANIFIAKDSDGKIGIYSVSTIVPSGEKTERDKIKNGDEVVLNYYLDSNGNPKKFVDKDDNAAKTEIIKSSSNVIEQKSTSETTNRYSGASNSVSDNTCSCISAGDNLLALNEKIAGSVNFNSQCGSTECYDDDGNQIPCSSSSNIINFLPTISDLQEESEAYFQQEKYSRIFIILLGLAIILFIMEIVKIVFNKF